MAEAAGSESVSARGDKPYRAVALVIATVAVLALLLALLQFNIITLLLLVFAGVLLSVLLNTLAELVSRATRLKHGWSLAIVLLGLIGLAALGIWVLAPRLADQFTQLGEQLPKAIQSLRVRLEHHRFSRYILQKVGEGPALGTPSRGWLNQATGVASAVLDVIIDVVVIVFVGLYLAAEPGVYRSGMIRLVPPRKRPRADEVLEGLNYTLRWWLIGQGISMFTVGSVTALGLWLLGVPLALALGIVTGLFTFVPNFGPLTAFSLAVLLALTISPEKALYVFFLYLAAMGFEGYLLTPLVQRRTIELPPAVTILAQVLMGWLVGTLGVMLAAPLAACVIVAVRMFYVEDVLRDRSAKPT